MSPSKPRRPFGLGVYLILLLVVAVLAALAGALVGVVESLTGAPSFWVTAVSLSVVFVLGSMLCVWWWRGIDEAAREAHKWAWWWGGSGGMAVGGAVLLSLRFSDEAPIDLTGAAPSDLIAGGMMAILLFQMAGYGIAWAFWWLRHR